MRMKELSPRNVELPPNDAPKGMYWDLQWSQDEQEYYWELKAEKEFSLEGSERD